MGEKKEICSRLSSPETWQELFDNESVKMVVESNWHGDSESKLFWTIDEGVSSQDLINKAWDDARKGAVYMSSSISDEEERNRSIRGWMASLSIVCFEKTKWYGWESHIEKPVDEDILIGRWNENE